jgi:hypothetical protein
MSGIGSTTKELRCRGNWRIVMGHWRAKDIPPVSDYAHWNEDAQRIWYQENRYDMENPLEWVDEDEWVEDEEEIEGDGDMDSEGSWQRDGVPGEAVSGTVLGPSAPDKKYSIALRAWIYIDIQAESKEQALTGAVHKAWEMVKDLPIDVFPEENDETEGIEEHEA